ncbi:hypothetical protein FRC12_009416 [Ceratobasidium sp. 428]|nr:hypothetical protein FRC12_009416 [Ceratobasidium sp. 428]
MVESLKGHGYSRSWPPIPRGDRLLCPTSILVIKASPEMSGPSATQRIHDSSAHHESYAQPGRDWLRRGVSTEGEVVDADVTLVTVL